jgi:hypothetical protein
MKQTKHTYCHAFGYVISKSHYEPTDEIVNSKCNFFEDNTYYITGPFIRDKLHYEDKDNCIIWLNVSGRMQVKNVVTGEIQDRFAGASNLITTEEVGTYIGGCIEPAIVFSIWPENNVNNSPVIPDLEYFKLEKGATYNAKIGTKLFLAEGTIQIDNNDPVSSTRQIRVQSGDKVFTAISDCYGFIFK